MTGMGRALMGTGSGRGDKRALEAAQQAISSPLLEDVSINGATGILINITDAADTKKTVRLRGLSMTGTPLSATTAKASYGVRVVSALGVHIEDCVMDNFAVHGISVAVTTAIVTELHVRKTVARNCVDGAFIQNTNASGLVLATVEDSQFSNNGIGFEVADHGRATLRNCTSSSNSTAGVGSGGTPDAELNVDNCTLSYNASAVAVGWGTARVSKSLIDGNTNGLNNFGGTIENYQNNQLRGNTNNTVGVITPVGQS
jgi:hypothetical protein